MVQQELVITLAGKYPQTASAGIRYQSQQRLLLPPLRHIVMRLSYLLGAERLAVPVQLRGIKLPVAHPRITAHGVRGMC
ncbi:hypothetical protein ABEP00_09165 [Heyndrickxia sporothermodurans]|uniref:hypothetical protein n=1 Tax=Heyndrickxia sporothermodurans TaxID=46224 RepID=UPI003D1AB19B